MTTRQVQIHADRDERQQLWGAAAGLIGFKLRDSRAPKGLDRMGPYAFIYDVMKELA